MPLLFEYGKPSAVARPNYLRQFLREIWDARLFIDPTNEITEAEAADSKYQPFLQFDGSQIRARNFVGFLQTDDGVIEIYPKVFQNIEGIAHKKASMLRHIFYWFSYCRKWKFPFTKAALETTDIDTFPELIIHLMASQFLDTVSNQPLSLYEPVQEALRTPRGSVNFKRYISNGFATGNLHIIDCDHEPFAFNNRVNRVIKHCARLLLSQTRLSENVRSLQETIFVLDEVDDVSCSIHDIESVSLNPFFSDYLLVLDVCRSILSQQVYSSHLSDLSQWCLLFPMEYIFEDFLAGFLETHFADQWKVEYQKSNRYLSDEPKAFMMQHDIFLTHRASGKEVIVDAKYKTRPTNFKEDPKRGVSQADLYQMTSYAFRRGCHDVVLMYPNVSEELQTQDTFRIVSQFEGGDEVTARAVEVPFWSIDNYAGLEGKLMAQLDHVLESVSG